MTVHHENASTRIVTATELSKQRKRTAVKCCREGVAAMQLAYKTDPEQLPGALAVVLCDSGLSPADLTAMSNLIGRQAHQMEREGA